MKLKKLYEGAKKIEINKEAPQRSVKFQRRTRTTFVNNSVLVYLTDSPDYCIANKRLGIQGTLNRECDHYKDDTCTHLCDSCGYRKHSYVREIKDAKCNCKFHWCCRVTCELCTKRKIFAKCAKLS